MISKDMHGGQVNVSFLIGRRSECDIYTAGTINYPLSLRQASDLTRCSLPLTLWQLE